MCAFSRLFALLIAAALLVGCNVQPVSDTAPRKAVTVFFRALVESDYPGAYEQLSQASRGEISLSELEQQRQEARAAGLAVVDFELRQPTSFPSADVAEVPITVSLASGKTVDTAVAVVREQGRWRVFLPDGL